MVVKLRYGVGVAMIWLAAVAGVSVTAWVAIDRAGRDLTGANLSSLRPASGRAPVVTTTPGSRPTPSEATPEPSATPQPPSTPEPSPAPEPSSAPAPSATRPHSPVPSPSGPSQTSPLSSTTPQDRSVSVAGGQVSVRCTGATILLRIAQPDNGWRVEVGKSGPDEVEVTFRFGADGAGGQTQVTALCAAGTPAFRVESQS